MLTFTKNPAHNFIAAINLVHMHVYLVYTENDKC